MNPKSLKNLRPRQPHGEQAKVRVNIMIDPDLLNRLDSLHGSRSSNIEKAVERLLKVKPKKKLKP
jgi:metal-responsive CopG/Arc/MetJ family transcriptional regulator